MLIEYKSNSKSSSRICHVEAGSLHTCAREQFAGFALDGRSVRGSGLSPAPAFFDQLVIDLRAFRQEHIGKGVSILVCAVSLECHVPLKYKAEAACLAFLRTVDPFESYSFGVLVVQHFIGVTVEDGDNGAGEVGSCEGSTQEKQDTGTAAPKASSCPTSHSAVPRYPSRWASTTNCAVVERTASSKL